MREKVVAVDEVLKYRGKRTPEELLKELADRIEYRCLRTDGTYKMPFDDPFLFDVLMMVLANGKSVRQSAPETIRAAEDSTVVARNALTSVRLDQAWHTQLSEDTKNAVAKALRLIGD